MSIAKRTGATVIANFEIAGWLQGKGLAEDKIHAQHIGGGYNYDFGRVKLTIAHHGSMLPDGSYGGNPAGFLISAGGKNIYLTCDTALFSDMALYGEEGIDLFVLPIGDNFTMGPADALRAVKLVNPKAVVSVSLQHLAAHRTGRPGLGPVRLKLKREPRRMPCSRASLWICKIFSFLENNSDSQPPHPYAVVGWAGMLTLRTPRH